MDDALDLGADRLPMQSPFSNTRGPSRSPPNIDKGGADGGTVVEGVENKERWLNCVMLNGSSWRAEKDVPEGRRAELNVFIGNGAQTKRRSSWTRERACEERLQNCSAKCTQPKRS